MPSATGSPVSLTIGIVVVAALNARNKSGENVWITFGLSQAELHRSAVLPPPPMTAPGDF
jgi:hypothetical protein